MSTASFELAQSIPARVDELSVLIRQAKAVQDTQESLYNAVCRACCVLMASHLEGFLKDLSTSITRDLNYNLGGFGQMPM
jgi:hypothetical protein